MKAIFYENLISLIDMVHDEAVAGGNAFDCGGDLQPDCKDSCCRSYPNCDRAKRVDEQIKALRFEIDIEKKNSPST